MTERTMLQERADDNERAMRAERTKTTERTIPPE